MVLDKISRYIYEINYKEKKNIDALSFDDLVEKLISASETERQEIYECLDDETKEKIDALIEGGLI